MSNQIIITVNDYDDIDPIGKLKEDNPNSFTPCDLNAFFPLVRNVVKDDIRGVTEVDYVISKISIHTSDMSEKPKLEQYECLKMHLKDIVDQIFNTKIDNLKLIKEKNEHN